MDFTKQDFIDTNALYAAIPKRFSSRKYTSDALTPEHQAHLIEFAAKASALFPNARLVIKEVDHSVFKMKFAVAKWMAAFVFKIDDQLARLNVGMLAELLLIEAARIGVRTVWLGGILDISASIKAAECAEDETVAGITPLGYVHGRSMLEKTAFGMMTGHKFKDGELVKRKRKDRSFFIYGPTPLTDWPEWALTALDAMILAASAKNKQPWRLSLEGSTLTLKCGVPGFVDMIPDDMGAGLVHVSLALANQDKTFKIEVDEGYSGKQDEVVAVWTIE